ncbi:LON peptidase substrate-binding domain-containing protein [Aliiglaciecola sp. LCG003]|uniref:LON peptidase substrate-binding domain-containing protein n=1 Tax=Aliiglaciecola sp. LCG003 TaxID=3053655 RepID=UPI002573B090|nr:LON peptidase substrate-binding domain-containing protein [Aliiglaciecola sp. LCG003]WJG08408.1 LON peptidase substrate-binding domain-containing protein [Aliiglaciecola sp. LCG003]
MGSNIFSAPLFPLSAHLLPGGMMSLRIFEPRYIRMVKEACANQTGFIICMLNSQGNKQLNQHIYPVGTYATVVDFDLLEDGLLGIKVQGHRCVTIDAIESQDDGLRVGQCQWQDDWSCDLDIDTLAPMHTRLQEIFVKYPEVNALYPKPEFSNPLWVIYRWLELLPVPAEQKQKFLAQKDCVNAVEFLSQLVE